MKLKQISKQVFLYLIVGGLATIVEWSVFYILNTSLHIHYTIATALAFIISTFANWMFGRLIMFHPTEKRTFNEILKIYFVSIIGLLLNILIMFIAIEKCGLQEMLSKIIATGLVFGWNFIIRKIWIYKNSI